MTDSSGNLYEVILSGPNKKERRIRKVVSAKTSSKGIHLTIRTIFGDRVAIYKGYTDYKLENENE